MKQFLALGIAALAIHANCSADVMYRWIGVDDGKPANVSMTLVFSDDAVASGSLNYHLPPMQTSTVPPALPGLKYFGFGVDGITPMSYTPGKELFRYGWGTLDMTLNFNPAGYVTGTIAANDANSNFAMSSNGDLFSFSDMHSDEDMMGTKLTCGIYGPVACTATGVLQRVSPVPPASGQVPEPGSLALVGLGLLGALGAGRAAKRRA